MQAVVVVEMAHQLVENLELGGFLEGGVHQIVDGGGADGVGGVDHEAHPKQRGKGVEVKTPGLTTRDQLQGQRNGHERVEAGLGKPEPGLGFNDGGVLVAQDPAVAGPDGEANEGVDAENDDTRQGAAGGDGMVEMADHLGEQEEGAAHHDQADGKADEVLEFADAVGKAMSGRLAEGQHRQVGSKHGEEIGALLEKVAEDGEGVGVPSGSGHEEDVAGAKGHAKQKVFLAGAGGWDAHEWGWSGELKSG